MRMSSLQLGLIVAGILLVVGVIAYNAWQERRIRRRIASAFRKSDDVLLQPAPGRRVEPTLRAASHDGDDASVVTTASENPAAMPGSESEDESSWSPPVDYIKQEPADAQASAAPVVTAYASAPPDSAGPQPDPDIECMVILQPAKPLAAGALAAGLHARIGKRLRWFGRTAPGSPWVLLQSATPGEFVELAACMLLADRNGAASHAQLDTFVRVMSELAPMLPAALSVPDVASETDRAEALDRLCADVDVQVGLTVLKQEPASIPGTKLRGMAEAAGFRLAPGGRFEWLHEDTGLSLIHI